MARPRNEKGVAGWLEQWWRALLAEVISTGMLVWLGCSTLVPIAGPKSVVLTHPALAFGFGMVSNICAFGETSGAHMNPAVTLGAVLYGKMDIVPALGYVVAQMIGAILGFSGLMAIAPSELVAAGVAVTLPGPGVTPLAAMATEAVITGMLVFAICGVWASHDPARPDPTVALKLGFVVAGAAFAGGPVTGASLNPARSFAAALLQGCWQHQWVYWVGPLLGAATAALVHRHLITSPSKPPTPEPIDVEVPLNDKP